MPQFYLLTTFRLTKELAFIIALIEKKLFVGKRRRGENRNAVVEGEKC